MPHFGDITGILGLSSFCFRVWQTHSKSKFPPTLTVKYACKPHIDWKISISSFGIHLLPLLLLEVKIPQILMNNRSVTTDKTDGTDFFSCIQLQLINGKCLNEMY